MITLAGINLEAMLGNHISLFCDNGYTSDGENHCAHFVAHVMGYAFGANCRVMGNGKAAGVSIRVQDIFPKCARVGAWAKSQPETDCLAFIGNAGNVHLHTKRMDAVSRLHIGFYSSTRKAIYHYSNKFRRVIRETPEDYTKHFPAPDNAVFWGTLPIGNRS